MNEHLVQGYTTLIAERLARAEQQRRAREARAVRRAGKRRHGERLEN